MSRKLGVLGGVQVYREPFLLPMENLPVGLGDTNLHSESKGLQGKSRDQQGLRGDPGLCSHRQLPCLSKERMQESYSSFPQAYGLRDPWLGCLHEMGMVALR